MTFHNAKSLQSLFLFGFSLFDVKLDGGGYKIGHVLAELAEVGGSKLKSLKFENLYLFRI
jgi:hypothetical protein